MNYLIPQSRKPGYLIDPVAFFLALIGGPLLVTALSFWILFIPVFALAMGGPIYLILGTPLLLIHLRRNPASINSIAFLAFLAVLAMFPLGAFWVWFTGAQDAAGALFFFTGFGLLFGPLWASAFGWIYLKLRRDFYAVARPV